MTVTASGRVEKNAFNDSSLKRNEVIWRRPVCDMLLLIWVVSNLLAVK